MQFVFLSSQRMKYKALRHSIPLLIFSAWVTASEGQKRANLPDIPEVPPVRRNDDSLDLGARVQDLVQELLTKKQLTEELQEQLYKGWQTRGSDLEYRAMYQQAEIDDDEDDEEEEDREVLDIDLAARALPLTSDQILQQGLYPPSHGVNLDEVFGHRHSPQGLRPGQASNDHMCDQVTSVPENLRNSAEAYPDGISTFYQKYTHAYGIPIVGSNNVTDIALKRICYAVRFMFRGRYDIRNAYYKFYGRAAAIGDGEEQTTLAEYTSFDPVYWNARARGLGATMGIPVTSVGGDNQKCGPGDRYWDQDNFVHEMSHGVHTMGGDFVIPGFSRYLGEAYRSAMADSKWGNSYSTRNPLEYFAVGSQFYLKAVTGMKFIADDSTMVKDSPSLKQYDPSLYNVIALAHPCGHDDWIERCSWKNAANEQPTTTVPPCTSGAFELVSEVSAMKKAACGVKVGTQKQTTAEACKAFACSRGATVFNYLAHRKKCFVYDCPEPYNPGLVSYHVPYEVYVRVDIQPATPAPPITENPLTAENSANLGQICTVGGPADPTGFRCAVASDEQTTCGWTGISSSDCQAIGCCFSQVCFYPNQGCVDQTMYCPGKASGGECSTNPGYMYKNCPFSCDICQGVQTIENLDSLYTCKDKDAACHMYRDAGYCTSDAYKDLLEDICAVTCGHCTVENNPYPLESITP